MFLLVLLIQSLLVRVVLAQVLVRAHLVAILFLVLSLLLVAVVVRVLTKPLLALSMDWLEVLGEVAHQELRLLLVLGVLALRAKVMRVVTVYLMT
jgi:hypothetical protein